ncbi:hypothetical protein MTO96_031226 [Rhipicephalus appendiculatus]
MLLTKAGPRHYSCHRIRPRRKHNSFTLEFLSSNCVTKRETRCARALSCLGDDVQHVNSAGPEEPLEI